MRCGLLSLNDQTHLHHFVPELYRSPTSVDVVSRPSLLEQLERHRGLPLTLISAPAGYGKTTSASCWLNTLDDPNAWISLDEQDNGLVLFLTYFLTAMRSMFPDSLGDTLALVNAPE